MQGTVNFDFKFLV